MQAGEKNGRATHGALGEGKKFHGKKPPHVPHSGRQSQHSEDGPHPGDKERADKAIAADKVQQKLDTQYERHLASHKWITSDQHVNTPYQDYKSMHPKEKAPPVPEQHKYYSKRGENFLDAAKDRKWVPKIAEP